MKLTPALILIAGTIMIILARYWSRRIRTKAERSPGSFVPDIDAFVFPASIVALLYVAANLVALPASIDRPIDIAFIIVAMFLAIRFVTAFVRRGIRVYFLRRGVAEKTNQVRGLTVIMNGLLWTVGLIVLLNNLGFDVTAIIAGLGIGGIAIALAAQTILGDLFNYFVILFDQPFEPGDFIIVDDKMGTIEYIGLKTTRVRSLQGEQIVFSNTNLTNSRIHNYKRMDERRVLFKICVVYETSRENLEAIPNLIKVIIDKHESARFDRAHFAAFGEYSLDFEVVYYVKGSDYNQYMDIQQQVNLAICEQFRQRAIEFAYPTFSLADSEFTVKAPLGKKMTIQPNGSFF